MSDHDFESTQTGIPLIEDISGSSGDEGRAQNSKKRKREGDATTKEDKKAARKKKRTKKKPQDIGALDDKLGVNRDFAHMDSRLLADHVAQRTKRFQPELSLVEAEDLFLPEKAIMDTTQFEQDRVADNIASFLEKFAVPKKRKGKQGKKLSDAPTQKGSPHTLVVAAAGLRAADLTRALRKFQTKEAMVAKLFAKHIKLKEAIETVKNTRMGIGVGTPQRLIDLLENGALSSDHLERIVIDASHIDQKKRGILDMKETQLPLLQLLTRSSLRERYGAEAGEKQVELIFF